MSMKLTELNDIFTMDAGAPQQLLISNERDTTLMFLLDMDAYTNDEGFDDEEDKLVGSLKFAGCIKISSGVPSNETLEGHPYFSAGLNSYRLYEVANSDLVQQLMAIQSIHPCYDATKWFNYKHFIINFHDSAFECVATKYCFKRTSEELYYDLVNAPSRD